MCFFESCICISISFWETHHTVSFWEYIGPYSIMPFIDLSKFTSQKHVSRQYEPSTHPLRPSWLHNRDPCISLQRFMRYFPHNWVIFHPLNTQNKCRAARLLSILQFQRALEFQALVQPKQLHHQNHLPKETICWLDFTKYLPTSNFTNMFFFGSVWCFSL